MHTFELGTLHTHIAHGQVFMVLADNRFSVTVQNMTLDKEFLIPIELFVRHWRPLGGSHE